MKKRVLFILPVLFIFMLSLASASEIKLAKEAYAPGETLQAEIYGNFIDGLKLENIFFYRERNIPVIYDILKLKDKYLLYALLPYTEGNYTLKIKNARYETEGGSSSAILTKEFKIQASNVTTLRINPGFIVAKEDFSIKVKPSQNAEISINFLGKKQNLSLVQGIEKKIDFSVSEIRNYTETAVMLGGYSIPVLIFPEKSSSELIQETGKFRFNPLEISAVVLSKENYFFKVSLVNLGEKNISSISLFSNSSSDLKIKISPDSISELGARDEKIIAINLSSEKTGNFSGNIIASSGNLSTGLKLKIEVTENKSKLNYEGPDYGESCTDVGKMCAASESCDGVSVFTKDGYCCQGNCVAEKESSSWVYGVVLIIAVLLGLFLLSVYMKKKQKKPIDILRERQKKYEDRMSGEEVTGNLAKS